MTNSTHDLALARYRGWFYGAAIYNLVWGVTNILFPHLLFDLLKMPQPRYTALWQVVGMFVLVYAPAYWWAARFPYRHRQIVMIGLAGKLLGPIGFVWSLSNGALPLSFGWTILTNDLIWWPAFALYLKDVTALTGGVAPLLRGK
jgi:small multidrug resistance pump